MSRTTLIDRRNAGTPQRAYSLDGKCLHWQEADGETVGYGKLILTTGSLPVRPPIPGMELKNVSPVLKEAEVLAYAEPILKNADDIVVIGGGFIGAEIKFAGYDHIIVKGKSDQPVYLYITGDSVEIKDANHLWGKDPWETQQLIREELGDRNIQSLSIGQAGENLVHFACVITGKLQSAAGRCGMGAIMGSKNLKAIAVRGKSGIALAESVIQP